MKIVCLANSYKHGGRCLAGIDLTSRQWIRPISDLEDGRIPLDNQYINIEQIKILNIIDIEIIPGLGSGYEIENHRYGNRPWEVVDQATVFDLLQHREHDLLYPGYGKSIPDKYLQTISLKDQSRRRTLQLIEVKSLQQFSLG